MPDQDEAHASSLGGPPAGRDSLRADAAARGFGPPGQGATASVRRVHHAPRTTSVRRPIVTNAPVKVAVTGAAGQICYSLLFRIASGATARP